MIREHLAAAIASAATLHGHFTLRSGRTASTYFDKYRFESEPSLLRAVAEHLVPMIPPETQALAGLELGGVPIATALALQTGMPVVFVRKHAKEYGTCQLAEGASVVGLRLSIIEDVVTSGGQVVESAQALRGLGAIVTHAVCVIDREAGGGSALSAAGIAMHSLFTMTDLVSASPAATAGVSRNARPLISVMLAVADAPAAVAWYTGALGATVLWSLGSVAGLELSGAPFFVGEPAANGWESPSVLGTTSTRIEVFCDEPDGLIARALASGATGSLEDLRDYEAPWGIHRQGHFVDPFGHMWLVGDRSPLHRYA